MACRSIWIVIFFFILLVLLLFSPVVLLFSCLFLSFARCESKMTTWITIHVEFMVNFLRLAKSSAPPTDRPSPDRCLNKVGKFYRSPILITSFFILSSILKNATFTKNHRSAAALNWTTPIETMAQFHTFNLNFELFVDDRWLLYTISTTCLPKTIQHHIAMRFGNDIRARQRENTTHHTRVRAMAMARRAGAKWKHTIDNHLALN